MTFTARIATTSRLISADDGNSLAMIRAGSDYVVCQGFLANGVCRGFVGNHVADHGVSHDEDLSGDGNDGDA